MTSTVAASIVTWNSAGTIAECLKSLLDQTRPLDRIYIHDNASSDDTGAIIERYGSSVDIVHADENTGFCGGHNAIIQRSRSDYLLLVNPDVRADPAYVRNALIAIERNSQIGTVSWAIAPGGAWIIPAGS